MWVIFKIERKQHENIMPLDTASPARMHERHCMAVRSARKLKQPDDSDAVTWKIKLQWKERWRENLSKMAQKLCSEIKWQERWRTGPSQRVIWGEPGSNEDEQCFGFKRTSMINGSTLQRAIYHWSHKILQSKYSLSVWRWCGYFTAADQVEASLILNCKYQIPPWVDASPEITNMREKTEVSTCCCLLF